MRYYDPPYIYGWLYYDGDRHGTTNYLTWRDKIIARMALPAPVTVTMWGDYNSANGTGTVNVQFRNDSTSAITGRVVMVITEDSIFYVAPNNDSIHNHVARDYLPDENGSIFTIQPGDSVTVSEPFTIQGGWDENQCDIYAWIQNDSAYADSTREIWQGGMIRVLELTGIKEEISQEITMHQIHPIPNPCVEGTKFTFNLPINTEYCIRIFDVTGCRIRKLTGKTLFSPESITWNCRDDSGSRVTAGVYLYIFETCKINKRGKIIVR